MKRAVSSFPPSSVMVPTVSPTITSYRKTTKNKRYITESKKQGGVVEAVNTPPLVRQGQQLTCIVPILPFPRGSTSLHTQVLTTSTCAHSPLLRLGTRGHGQVHPPSTSTHQADPLRIL
ncbi:hypothetical protein Pcinc_023397 [Petrolisthes cinctipes]|uniref:Uncharacterized protein n=1 Tax=Petrolisthes cinctipes TaxID=88211 RepID=A0AAE1FFJ6_PETCI|nr:hypothetical protein Pcinc_023397 [Petrolisthes cinctipes]